MYLKQILGGSGYPLSLNVLHLPKVEASISHSMPANTACLGFNINNCFKLLLVTTILLTFDPWPLTLYMCSTTYIHETLVLGPHSIKAEKVKNILYLYEPLKVLQAQQRLSRSIQTMIIKKKSLLTAKSVTCNFILYTQAQRSIPSLTFMHS